LKYYIIAGEPSGDLHGANLIKELKKTDPSPRFRFWGGDLMQAQAGLPVKHIRETSFMGFREVLLKIPEIWSNIRFCKKNIKEYNPDALVLIDYPGFNMIMAKYASKIGIPVIYYISPQIWAWHRSRVKKIKQYVDLMLTILPFEKDFYRGYNYNVQYVGHPLMDAMNQYRLNSEDFSTFIKRNYLENKPIIALLPGSRKQEIEKCLPAMLQMVPQHTQYQFVIAGAPNVGISFYQNFTKDYEVSTLFCQTYSILRQSQAAIVVSGTATLEAALMDVPQIVCYKSGQISYLLGKNFIKVPFISLVNLILNREAVKELVQHEMNNEILNRELESILNDKSKREQILSDYREIKKLLGRGSASEKAARKIYNHCAKAEKEYIAVSC